MDRRGSAALRRAVGGGLPPASAVVTLQAEFAADGYAATHRVALLLAVALHATSDAGCAASGWPRRLLASHPNSEQRIPALLRKRVASHI